MMVVRKLLANSGDTDQMPHSESALFAYVPQKGGNAYMG